MSTARPSTATRPRSKSRTWAPSRPTPTRSRTTPRWPKPACRRPSSTSAASRRPTTSPRSAPSFLRSASRFRAMFEWSDEQKMIKDAVRQVVEKEIAPQVVEFEHGDTPPYDVLRLMFKTFGMDAMSAAGFDRRIAKEEAGEAPKPLMADDEEESGGGGGGAF